MVTRNDVARHAGVSVAVVSYVINNKPNVKESTRQKVMQAIEELGYKPNLTARSLRTKKTNQLGVLVNNLGDPFETGILLGLERKARTNDQFLFIQTYHREEEEQLKNIFMGRTDGILLMGQSLQPETISYFTKTGVPIYSITKPVKEHLSVHSVDIDWYAAMVRLIRHLRDFGHTHIGFMANEMQERHHHVRYLGFLKAMEDAGLPFSEEHLIYGRGTLESAYDVMKKRLALEKELPFTAMICANDLMAVGVLSACRDDGIDVPGQLSVAGCEDILMASHTLPALTTIHYPRPEIGSIAVEMLLQKINGEQPIHCTVSGELSVRQSTGPL